MKEYGSPISNGLLIENLKDILEITSKPKGKQFVVKAQIHAGGREAGGVKLVKSFEELQLDRNDGKNS